MITLYQFERTWDIPNLSHFCVKIETYLRMARLPYKVVCTLPLKAPRGKLPYIEDNGRKISDSLLILDYLQSTYGDSLNAGLSIEEKSITKAFQRLIEEHLYWVSMYTRWNYSEANWQTNKQAIFGGLPSIARDVVAWGYRRRIKSQIRGHGMGLYSPEEVITLGLENINALADFLGDKPYFMGQQPTALDATAFGFLVNTIGCPIESPVKEYALTKKNLNDYCRRMQAEFFPELPALMRQA
ncbi:MAG: glutathione S-transferase family protein [Methylobacter sp.]